LCIVAHTDVSSYRKAGALEGRLRAPVGLGLDGHGPETLALAIAAELQQYFAEPC